MRRSRMIKIVATLGPASNTHDHLRALSLAGADVFRINMSHTSHPNLKTLVETVRAVEAELGRPISILVDLQGPKLRLGKLGAERKLQTGSRVTFVRSETASDAQSVPIPHPEIFAALKPGSNLLIDDGKVRLVAHEVEKDRMTADVVQGGTIKDHKGVNLPDTLLPIPALTPKDRADLDYALSLPIDWLGLSFVQRPDDVAELRKMTAGRAGVLSKIEKPAALQSLDEILTFSDAVMVARGDLGVELPLEAVPGRQKQIIQAARHAGKPVVVATQMLESMISSPVPTRAEVSDVANAVYEGADAVMLSAETAAGAYPDRGRRRDGSHRARGRGRFDVSRHHGGAASGAGGDHARRHPRRRARRDAYHQGRRHRVLDQVRLDRFARRARAARSADPRADAEQGDGAASHARLGTALRRDRRRPQSRRCVRTRLSDRIRARLREDGRSRRDHRRSAARHARRHQSAARRLRHPQSRSDHTP